MRLFSIIKPIVEHFPKIARIYRSLRDQLDIMEEPKLTPWGFKLAGNLAMTEGIFEPLETELVRKILKDVDVLVNVGANVGYYCCHALSMGKSVIAFEPIERNLQLLCKNIKANGWENAEIFPVALSNKIEILEIYGGKTGASLVKGWAGILESYKVLVPSLTMDVVLHNRLQGIKSLILVDIEGAEKLMLEGATKILTNDPPPIWVVEITSKELQPLGVKINPNFKITFDIFFQHGYQAFDLEQSMSPMTKELVEKIFTGKVNFNSNNFLFSK